MINNLNGSLEAERNVLGSVLIDESCVARVFSALTEEAFASVDKRNALVFRAMKALSDDRKPIDITTVNSQLAIMQLDKECNSPEFILELAENTIDPNNIDFYINTVRDYHTLRQFFDRMDSAKKDFVAGKVEDIGDFVNTVATELTLISNQRSVGSFKTSDEVVKETLNVIARNRDLSNKRLTGLDTGYPRLNELTHGFQPGSLNIIAARPSVGKTAFAINLIVNAAQSVAAEGKTIAFFSCEMDSSLIMQRVLAAKSMVPITNIQLGNLSNAENNSITMASAHLEKLPIYFDDTPNQYLGDIIAKCEKIATSSKGKLGAVFIDYLNIIKVPNSRSTESRTLQIALITSQLKELARRLKLPVICLAQLNRDADKGTYVAGKGQVSAAPELSSLKESSSIEQDADTIMMLYRADWAGKNNNVSSNQSDMPVDPSNETFKQKLQRELNDKKAQGKDIYDTSIVEIGLQKNRNGQTGKTYLLFEKAIQLFSTPSVDFENGMSDLDA